MNSRKTKAQLLEEMEEMRRRLAELEELEDACRRAEGMLRDSREELAAIFDNAPITMVLIDQERRVRKANHTAGTFANRSVEEMVGLRGGEALRCLNSLDDPRGCGFGPACATCAMRRVVLDTLATGKGYHQVEASLPLDTGKGRGVKDFMVTTTPVVIENEQMVLVSFEDVTERKRMEEERERLLVSLERRSAQLEAAEEHLRTLFDSIHDLVFVVDREGRFIEFHQPSLFSLLYVPPEQFLGRRFDDVLPRHVAERMAAAIRGIDETGKVRQFDYALEIAGREMWFAANVNAVRDKEGKTISYIAVIRDITARKQIESALRQSEEMAHVILNASADSIFLLDPSGVVLAANRVGAQQFEREVGEIVGLCVYDLMEPDVAASRKAHLDRAVRTGESVRFEDVRRGIYYDTVVHPVLDGQGRVARLAVFAHDVTERRSMDEALRRYIAELEARNEELDAFAHTVAHDLKNPLALIIGYSEALEESGDSLPMRVLEPLRAIAQGGRRMARIVDELLLLAEVRKTEVELGPLDMGDAVAEALRRLADLVEEREAEIVLPESWPAALGYGPWVEEVWTNYLSNALKYGGRPPHVELGAATLQPDGLARFWVRDNGPGLAEEDQARLFVPFTRLGQVRVTGHGLGLSIVRRIMDKLGGQVGVESEIGEGSTFWFVLPAA